MIVINLLTWIKTHQKLRWLFRSVFTKLDYSRRRRNEVFYFALILKCAPLWLKYVWRAITSVYSSTLDDLHLFAEDWVPMTKGYDQYIRGVKESVLISISVSRRKVPVSFSCFAVWPRPKGPFTVSLILHLRNFCFNSDHLEYLSFQLLFAIGFVVVVVVVIVIFCYLLKTKKAVS